MTLMPMDTFNLVYEQTKQLLESPSFVRCGCLEKLKPHQSYKCLYCEVSFCKRCAEQHFGKTVNQYKMENKNE